MPRLFVLLAPLVVGGLVAGGVTHSRASDRARMALERATNQARVRELDMAFYEKRAQRDPTGAADLAHLAGLYLQRARDAGGEDDLLRAEAAARRSLAHRAVHNAKAHAVLAAVLSAQHRFAEAREVAAALVASDPDRPSLRALLAEIDAELGRYDEARRLFGELWGHRADLAVGPRLARWEEIQGRSAQARRLLLEATAEVERRADLPVGQVAWFHLRTGELAFRNGELRAAERAFAAGFAAAPEDHRLLAARARLEAVRHRWRQAIDFGERAIARAVDPATLGLLHDAYAAVGDSARADDAFRAMLLTSGGQAGPLHRAAGLFLLDHDHDVARVLAKAREELATRRDIYGYDLLAWALYQSGRAGEAREPMSRALSLGTRDPALFYHAGMIERAAGDCAAARRHLEAALSVSRYWHPFQPSTARAVLDSIAVNRGGGGEAPCPS
jgi:tetratricopeptide (TPR) repeat protein